MGKYSLTKKRNTKCNRPIFLVVHSSFYHLPQTLIISQSKIEKFEHQPVNTPVLQVHSSLIIYPAAVAKGL